MSCQFFAPAGFWVSRGVCRGKTKTSSNPRVVQDGCKHGFRYGSCMDARVWLRVRGSKAPKKTRKQSTQRITQPCGPTNHTNKRRPKGPHNQATTQRITQPSDPKNHTTGRPKESHNRATLKITQLFVECSCVIWGFLTRQRGMSVAFRLLSRHPHFSCSLLR